jgi:hypothetical protein
MQKWQDGRRISASGQTRTSGRGRAKSTLPSTADVARPPGLARHGHKRRSWPAVRRFRLPPTAELQRPQIAQWYLDKKPSFPSASSPRFAGAMSGWLTSNASRSACRLLALWLQATPTSRSPTARCVRYRIEALLRDNTSMITASTATNRRRSTPLGFEAALSRTATEASARACARSESAASEAATSWAGSARKPSPARVLSLPGSP